MRKERRDTLFALHGHSSAELKEDIKDSEFQVVTIEKDPRISEYTSDEEESSMSRGRTPTQGERSATGILGLERQDTKLVEKTPIDHRRRTKMLKAFAQRRFSSANWMPPGAVG